MIRTLTFGLALVGAVAALAAPAAARIDPPSDARHGPGSAAALQDLRSPDARDAALPRKIVVLTLSGDRRPAEADGFDWNDAALGSGAAAGLLLLLGGAGALTLARSRRESRHAAQI
jgi:hypothetical protein